MRGLVFLAFFIIFILIKLALQGGKKILEVGAEAYDAVNDTNISKRLKKPKVDELAYEKAVIGLFAMIAYEDEQFGQRVEYELEEKIDEILHRHFALRLLLKEGDQGSPDDFEGYLESHAAMYNRFKNELMEIVKQIKRARLSFSKNDCFFKEFDESIKSFANAVNYFDDNTNESRSLKTVLYAELIQFAYRKKMSACQKYLLYTIGKYFGFSNVLIKSFLDNGEKILKEEEKWN